MRNLLVAVLMVAFLPMNSDAVEEKIAPFDTSGNVFEITQDMEKNLSLFPEIENFSKARLWETEGELILEIEKTDGNRIRDSITEEKLIPIREKISAMTPPLDQSGRGRFLYHHLALSYLVHAPCLVSIIAPEDPATGTGLYLVSSSIGFYLPWKLTKNKSFSRAQQDMSFYMGTRGALWGALISWFFDLEEGREFAMPILATSIGGEILGYNFAQKISIGQSRATGAYTDFGMLEGYLTGHLIQIGKMGDDFSTKTLISCVLSGAVLGGGLGVYRARTAPYTEGNVTVIQTSGILGGTILEAIYLTIRGFEDWEDWTDNDKRLAFAMPIIGIPIGMGIGERLVKKLSLKEGDGLLISAGTTAGALLGLGLSFLFVPDPTENTGRVYSVLPAIGALAGFTLTYRGVAK
ncbi:hypothetical protein KAW50_04020 [candidate division WOR-3 bacterium]|nr:hypothetical protein [candidate division WOR-3 bacterium]